MPVFANRPFLSSFICSAVIFISWQLITLVSCLSYMSGHSDSSPNVTLQNILLQSSYSAENGLYCLYVMFLFLERKNRLRPYLCQTIRCELMLWPWNFRGTFHNACLTACLWCYSLCYWPKSAGISWFGISLSKGWLEGSKLSVAIKSLRIPQSAKVTL